jgi:PAS domain S-box-containing protein
LPIPTLERSWLRGALLGLAALGILTLGKLALAPTPAGPELFLMHFMAVLAAGWYGGLRAGIAVTAIAVLLDYVVAHSAGQPKDMFANVIVFGIEGVAVSWFASLLEKERRRVLDAAKSAQEATDKLEVVLRGMTDGVTMQDHTGQLVYANEAAARVVGFPSVHEFLAAPISEVMQRFELFDEQGSPFPFTRLPNRILFDGGTPEETLLQFKLKGSEEIHWSLVHANAIRDEMGRLRFVVNVFRDVTERQLQEAALRVSREWFSTALRSIGDAVIATDPRSRVTFLNPIAETLTGWPLEEAMGRPLEEVFTILSEETRLPVESPVQKVLEQGAVVGLANHTLLLRRDGEEMAIDDSAAPIRGSDGVLAGVVLVFRDVTAERRAAERRDFLARATIELNSSLDYAGTLATVARLAVPRMADWCAVDIVEAGELRRLAVTHVDPSKVTWVEELQRRYPPYPEAPRGTLNILRTGKPEIIAEIPASLLTAVACDAEHLALIQQLELRSYIGVPLSRGGQTFGVITLVMAESKRTYGDSDLEVALALADRAAVAVENARLYRAAEHARTEAVDANQAKDDFLAMLGHELRNPLAPIVTALDLMKRRPGAALDRERLVIERQVRHVIRLVDDLLDVSRILHGRVELAKEAIDIADVVAKALELASPLIKERQQHVSTHLQPGLSTVGDSVRLIQVLTNLLTNAAKYTDPGGHLELSAVREDTWIVLSVKDDGSGIEPEMLSRIFDLFVQAPQTIERARGGLGLGLTIVQSLVKLSGGSIEARSDGPGKGSEFVVRLQHVAAEEETWGPSTPPTPSPLRGARVLVVDDNVDAREMLAQALQLLGHEAHAAGDAQEALAVAARVNPEFALLDIGLPEVDGYELGRRLRALPGLGQIQLAALTGYGQDSDHQRSREAGFKAHLVKPVDIAAIQALLRNGSADGT